MKNKTRVIRIWFNGKYKLLKRIHFIRVFRVIKAGWYDNIGKEPCDAISFNNEANNAGLTYFQTLELQRCKSNLYFAENYIAIMQPDGTLKQFELREFQKDFLNKMDKNETV